MSLLSSLPLCLQGQEPPIMFSILFISTFFFLFLKRGKSEPNAPPSPPKLPLIGNLHQLGKLPHRSLCDLSQKYGPIMLLHMGTTPTLIISSGDMAKEILKTHDVAFANRPITTASKAFLYGNRDIVFAPYGEYWREVRKIAVIDLLSVKRVESFRFIRKEELAIMLDKITKARGLGTPVNLGKTVATSSNNIISRIAFGRKLEGETGGHSDILHLIKEVMDLFGIISIEDMFPSLGWVDVLTGLDKRMKRVSKRFHQFLDDVVEQHMNRKRNDYENKDFVDILIDLQKDASFGIPLTKNEVKALVLDMFIAGTDTTSTTVEWVMAELIKDPKVMKRVQEEVRLVVGEKSMVDENDINQMSYLNCVLKETLRLHPPLPMALPHVTSVPVKIGNYSIPAKTRAIINLWAIGRDPNVWDRPDDFIPDRFIDNPIDFKGLDFEYIPFGAGRRGCPGIAFAIASVGSVVANLLYSFDWELPAGASKENIDDEAFGLAVHLKQPLCLVPLSKPS